jgi:hypothetical protein
MSKKLTPSAIKQDNKKYSVVERIYLDDNKEIYLDIKPNFKPTEVSEVIDEFISLASECEKNDIHLKDEVLYLFLDAVAVNHFSNLNLSKKDSVKYIEGLLSLIDLSDNGFSKILQSYPAENWVNLMQKYFERAKSMTDILAVTEKIKQDKDKTIIPENVLADKSKKIEQVIQEATESVKSDEKTEDMKLETTTDATV